MVLYLIQGFTDFGHANSIVTVNFIYDDVLMAVGGFGFGLVRLTVRATTATFYNFVVKSWTLVNLYLGIRNFLFNRA